MVHRHYRQLFLFLIVLILPSIMIGVQGWDLRVKEKELAARRKDDLERSTALAVGQEIAARLERLKTQEMANTPSPLLAEPGFSDPAVVAVGWVDGGRLVWPWDNVFESSERPSDGPEFEKALNEARIAEFRQQRDDESAAVLYRRAVDAAQTDSGRADAGLGLGRVLARSRQEPQAAAVYRELLKMPSSAIDSNSLSYWTYAAAPLAALGYGREVLDRVLRDLESPVAWQPIQIGRFRSILGELRSVANPSVRETAASTLARLEKRQESLERLKEMEELRNVQANFAKLHVRDTSWVPYSGTELWVVGRAPEGTVARPLVVVARLETVRQSVAAERSALKAGPRFEIVRGVEGESLGDSLPELSATFPDGVTLAAEGADPHESVWGLSIILVGVLTFLGGYLLWRDVRREGHLAELRTQFVSSVSHELKTPLTSIRMFAELLQMRAAGDPDQLRFLDTIVSESERLTRLLNNVLDFSRIERGQKQYRMKPTQLDEVVQSAVRTIQYPLAQQGFVLNLNLCEGIPEIPVDRDAMQQAVINLLTNAMKYSGQCREIGLRLCSDNGDALIEVSDGGIGIPAKEQPHIFEKFYRAHVPENKEISGTGLGLAMVAHITNAHGGSVRVKSNPGEGSTFSIRLPLNAGGDA